jgi:hypothetical protein
VNEIAQLLTALGALLVSCGGGYVYIDKRLKALQAVVDRCHEGHEITKAQLLTVGIVAGLMAERMQQVVPDDAVFKMAREKLERIFPVDHDTPSQLAELMKELRKIPVQRP